MSKEYRSSFEQSPSLSSPLLFENGSFNLVDAESQVLLRQFRPQLLFSNGDTFQPILDDSHVEFSRRYEDQTVDSPIRFAAERIGEGIQCFVTVTNTSEQDWQLAAVDLIQSDSGFYDVPNTQVRVSQTGWQAQSPVHPPRPLSEHETITYSLRTPECQVGPMPGENDDRVHSPWLSKIEFPDGRLIVAGFVSAKAYIGDITFGENDSLIAFTNIMEDQVLEPGESIQSEKVYILSGKKDDEQRLLSLFADRLAEEMGATPLKENIIGWSSWYREYPPSPSITEGSILSNLTKAAELKEKIGISSFHIDDGHQQDIGDWEANDKFPRGRAFLAEQIKAHGLTPGIWVAPFMISDQSTVFGEHPEWLVKDEHGQPQAMKYHGGWERMLYALDTTHPEAENWLSDVISMFRQEGFDLFKLDFTYAAAAKGHRYDEQATSIQAYRKGMQIIREAAGDATLLGCQGPHFASVGLVDINRIGHDVKAIWDEGKPLAHSSLKHALLALQEDTWMNGKLWQNDPDVILARAHNTELTHEEARSWMTAVYLAKGTIMLGDDLGDLEPDRLAEIQKISEVCSERQYSPAVPTGSMSEEGLYDRHHATDGKHHLLALYNWEDKPASLYVDPQSIGLATDTPYRFREVWTETSGDIGHGRIVFNNVGVHGVRLLQIEPVQAINVSNLSGIIFDKGV